MCRAASPMADDENRRRDEVVRFDSLLDAHSLEMMQRGARRADAKQARRVQSETRIRPAVFAEARQEIAERRGEERVRAAAQARFHYSTAGRGDAIRRALPKRARNASIPSGASGFPS